MDYEKEYKKLKAGISNAYLYAQTDSTKAVLESILPELKESEDEKSKKWILEYLHDGLRKSDEQFKDQFKSAITWLERQDAQKPAEWSKEDERICQCLIRDQEKALDDVCNDKYGHSEIISDLKEMYRERIDWLESLKDHCTPQWKPSEEQIDAIEVSIAYMTDESETPTTPKVLSELLEQLKNL